LGAQEIDRLGWNGKGKSGAGSLEGMISDMGHATEARVSTDPLVTAVPLVSTRVSRPSCIRVDILTVGYILIINYSSQRGNRT